MQIVNRLASNADTSRLHILLTILAATRAAEDRHNASDFYYVKKSGVEYEVKNGISIKFRRLSSTASHRDFNYAFKVAGDGGEATGGFADVFDAHIQAVQRSTPPKQA